MRHALSTGLIFALLTAGSLASEARANTIPCGGNSYSYGEVVPAHRGKARRGPIEAVPDSLCADLIETRPRAIESLQLTLDPRTQPARPSAPKPE